MRITDRKGTGHIDVARIQSRGKSLILVSDDRFDVSLGELLLQENYSFSRSRLGPQAGRRGKPLRSKREAIKAAVVGRSALGLIAIRLLGRNGRGPEEKSGLRSDEMDSA